MKIANATRWCDITFDPFNTKCEKKKNIIWFVRSPVEYAKKQQQKEVYCVARMNVVHFAIKYQHHLRVTAEAKTV